MRYWTYAEIKNKVQKDLGLEEEDFVSPEELLGYCNEAIDEAEGEIHTLYEDYFLDSVSLELINGQSTYTLPEGIFASKIRSIIYNDGSEVYPIRRFKEHKKFEKIGIAQNSTTTDYQYVLKNTIVPIPPEPSAWEAYDILPWVSGTAYVPGDQVTEAGDIYECVDNYSELFFSPTVPHIFEETFTDAGVLTFSNPLLAEVSGGVLQQIDQRITNAQIAGTFTYSMDASWSRGGSLTHSVIGTPVYNNTLGVVECYGGGNNGIAIVCADIGNCQNNGFLKVKVTVPFVGAPATSIGLFEITEPNPASDVNKIRVSWNSTGNLLWSVWNSAGVNILNNGLIFGWTPGPGTYELALGWDTANPNRFWYFYINGTRVANTTSGSMSRSGTATRIRFGGNTMYGACDLAFDDFILYNTTLHTGATYTAGYTLPEATYVESSVTCPEWDYTNLLDLFLITATESGSKFTIRLKDTADFLYHDGANWVISNRTYAQANTLAEINANQALLDLETADGLQMEVYFPTSNTQAYVDVLSYTVSKYAWTLISAVPNKYEVEDLVRYNNVNYECAVGNYDITFDPAKWTALAPYSTVPVPEVQLMLIPAPQEDSTNNVTIWYIRNANRMAVDEDICDIPEFTSFIIQYMKVRCYEKEQNENLQFATTALEALRAKMINTLTVKEVDDDNQIEMDLSDYEDSTGV